jgi:hypothetical protein
MPKGLKKHVSVQKPERRRKQQSFQSGSETSKSSIKHALKPTILMPKALKETRLKCLKTVKKKKFKMLKKAQP